MGAEDLWKRLGNILERGSAMIDTSYTSMYNQMWNAKNSMSRNNGKMQDKTHMSRNMEYLADAKAKAGEKSQAARQKKDTASTEKNDKKVVTQEDFQKLYAKLNGINYGEYDEKDSSRQIANTFLNEMVFSHMGSSKELFVPNMSRNVLSAAFNAAYDSSDIEDRIKNASEDSNSKSEKEDFETGD